ncbi:hypothetical protein DFO45_0629 [Azorhizobium sp. AG788]|jgi:hypothetical protein|nr:hypothetical protein DFO45_0629 [Azorhizobium sp. AG788]
MTPHPQIRDGQRPPSPEPEVESAVPPTDAVPAGCLCRGRDAGVDCRAPHSTCDDVPVMFFS